MDEDAQKLQHAVLKKKHGVADRSLHYNLVEKFNGECSSTPERELPQPPRDHVQYLQMLPGGWKTPHDRNERNRDSVGSRKSDAGSHDEAKRKVSTVEAADEATATAESNNASERFAGEQKRKKIYKSEQNASDKMVPLASSDEGMLETLRKETNPTGWKTSQKASQEAAEAVVNTMSDSASGSDGTGQAKERKHKCHLCDKAFKYPSLLKQHMMVHTGEKPYKCQTCDMAFSRSDILVEHIRVHSGEKPFKCLLCNMAFSQSGTLRRHEKYSCTHYIRSEMQ